MAVTMYSTRPARGWMAAALVVAMVLAGCSAKPPVLAVAAPVDPCVPETNRVEGQVLDDEKLPLAAVQLVVRPGEANTTTDADGHYVLCGLPSGRIFLYATLIGYDSSVTPLDVKATGTIVKDVELRKVIVRIPYAHVLGPFDGYLECSVAVGGLFVALNRACGTFAAPTTGWNYAVSSRLWTNDKNQFFFNLTSPEWTFVVVEAKWKGGTSLTDPFLNLLYSYKDRTPGHLFAESNATASPAKVVKQNGVKHVTAQGGNGSEPAEPDVNTTGLVWVNVPYLLTGDGGHPSIAHELRFQIMITVFYNMKPEKDYTAFT